jgi:hypothetical protein
MLVERHRAAGDRAPRVRLDRRRRVATTKTRFGPRTNWDPDGTAFLLLYGTLLSRLIFAARLS